MWPELGTHHFDQGLLIHGQSLKKFFLPASRIFSRIMFEASITHHKVRKGWPSHRVSQDNMQALSSNLRIAHFDHLLQEEGVAEAMVADLVRPQGRHSSCFVVRTRATLQEHAIIPSTSRKSLLRQLLKLHS
jgi:hypothetical protein